MNGVVVKFKYPEFVSDHYRYRGAVDNQNSLRHDGGTKSPFFSRAHGEQLGGPSRFKFF